MCFMFLAVLGWTLQVKYGVCTSDRYGVVRLPVRTRTRHRVCNKLIITSASMLMPLLTKYASEFACVVVTEPSGAVSPIDHLGSS
jgi:p-aminobenzoyl-glutamate transporter AbgT